MNVEEKEEENRSHTQKLNQDSVITNIFRNSPLAKLTVLR